jgi:hypothetical protein
MVLSSIFKSDFGTVGRGFESLWVRFQWERLVKPFLFLSAMENLLKPQPEHITNFV